MGNQLGGIVELGWIFGKMGGKLVWFGNFLKSVLGSEDMGIVIVHKGSELLISVSFRMCIN